MTVREFKDTTGGFWGIADYSEYAVAYPAA